MPKRGRALGIVVLESEHLNRVMNRALLNIITTARETYSYHLYKMNNKGQEITRAIDEDSS